MDDLEYESVLFVARECYVYRVPPRKSAAGYKAAEWGDMEAFLWKGRLRVIEKGNACSIRLEDKDSGELFALSPYDLSGQSVEPVLDSSRYFVLRVENEGGKRAFIGMGFQDRSDSFDFQVALQDWTKRNKAAKAAEEAAARGEDLAAASGLQPQGGPDIQHQAARRRS
ncbi:aaa atpase containing von willebrand factor type a [Ceraceosorus bombacis]|uniref:Aaa atpase containing von willebrand factor type a n=1 Tax=Ceraceosorus bombacis TaxID=401625 RepID=A0A0P1BK98_9BASI|nr:aaa atpase containing von willebrand factor type a [Ceraceosorus bombacis]